MKVTPALQVSTDALRKDLGGAAEVGRVGWKRRAQEAGLEAEAEEYEQAKKRHRAAKLGAESAAIEGYELRCYRERQLTLRQDKARSMAVLATHTWAPRSVRGCGDRVRPRSQGSDGRAGLAAQAAACRLCYEGSILQVGALHVLPPSGTPAQVYESRGWLSGATGCAHCVAPVRRAPTEAGHELARLGRRLFGAYMRALQVRAG